MNSSGLGGGLLSANTMVRTRYTITRIEGQGLGVGIFSNRTDNAGVCTVGSFRYRVWKSLRGVSCVMRFT